MSVFMLLLSQMNSKILIVLQAQNDINHQTDEGSKPFEVSLLVRGYSVLAFRFLDWASVPKGSQVEMVMWFGVTLSLLSFLPFLLSLYPSIFGILTFSGNFDFL